MQLSWRARVARQPSDGTENFDCSLPFGVEDTAKSVSSSLSGIRPSPKEAFRDFAREGHRCCNCQQLCRAICPKPSLGHVSVGCTNVFKRVDFRSLELLSLIPPGSAAQEVHVLNKYETDFYGDEMRVVVLGCIRPEQKFSSVGEPFALLLQNFLYVACFYKAF